ncbi:SH3 domain-containing protein [Propioniciclava soli]|uniref:SH3 domain-containing protein n=1 Tax=Propioniciclava soli TaxID=2775081 RepID=A0ABZ3C693_9ACTN|nr:SH3 domain-containing protein [Propioniciclava soli]
MSNPRRLSETAVECPEQAQAEAFNASPRRQARTQGQLLRARIAPTAVSLALLGGVTGLSFGLKGTETAVAVPAPVRADDATSRTDARAALESAETLAADDATAEVPAEGAAEVPADAAAEVPADAAAEAPAEPVAEPVTFAVGSWTTSIGAAAGDKYAQKTASLRARATQDSDKLGSLKVGDKIAVTDKVENGYRQVNHDGKVAWVYDELLADTPPVVETPKPVATAAASSSKASSGTASASKASSGTASAAAASSSGSAETYTGSTSYSGGSVLGLKPKAMVVYNAVTAKWSFQSIGGYRASSLSNHQYGGAIDFMTFKDSAKGWAVANYVAANADAFGIDHIIFEQKIWTPYRPYWRPMADRGSITANHYDHVHVSVKL